MPNTYVDGNSVVTISARLQKYTSRVKYPPEMQEGHSNYFAKFAR